MQSTLILLRETGAIVRTSGLVSKSSSANPDVTLPAPLDGATDGYTNGRKESGLQSAEDVARAALQFVSAAGTLLEELDEDEEVKLLRLRTKKYELVIYPGRTCCVVNGIGNSANMADDAGADPKYLLVLIHDTPPA